MDVRELRYFVAVFTHRSLTRAAQALFISQPALSRAIKDLEKECGVPLFQRNANGATPTAAAHALFPHAKATVKMAEDAASVARHGTATREPVEVGLAPGLDPVWLDSLCDLIEEAVPSAVVGFVDLVSSEQVRQVRQARLDLGIVHESDPPGLFSRLARRDELGVAIDPASALASDAPIRLVDLDGVRVLSHARDQVSTTHDLLLAAARQLSVAPQWQFGSYTENARIAARATRSVAALMTSSTASRLMPDWTWRVLVDPSIAIDAYVVRSESPRPVVAEVAGAIEAAASVGLAGSAP